MVQTLHLYGRAYVAGLFEGEGWWLLCAMCIFLQGPRRTGKLVNSPLNKFKDAVNTLRQHSKKSYHVHAVSDMLLFMQVMNNE